MIRSRHRVTELPEGGLPSVGAAPLYHGITDPGDAARRAYVAIGHVLQKQAYVLAFSDTFYLLGFTLAGALLATALLEKPDHMSAGGAH